MPESSFIPFLLYRSPPAASRSAPADKRFHIRASRIVMPQRHRDQTRTAANI
jgi:hypothetical protein